MSGSANYEETLGVPFNITDFSWTSSNIGVATVDNEGNIQGLTDGYTTIYAKHKTYEMYAMCIVNVSENIATPMIGTGNGFTIILKADGTVWGLRKLSKWNSSEMELQKIKEYHKE